MRTPCLDPDDTFILPRFLHTKMKNGQEIEIGQTPDEEKFQQAVNQLLNWRYPNEMKLYATGKDADFLEQSILLSQELFPPSRDRNEGEVSYRDARKQREKEYLFYIDQLS